MASLGIGLSAEEKVNIDLLDVPFSSKSPFLLLLDSPGFHQTEEKLRLLAVSCFSPSTRPSRRCEGNPRRSTVTLLRPPLAPSPPSYPFPLWASLRAGPAARGAGVRASRQPNCSTPPVPPDGPPTAPRLENIHGEHIRVGSVLSASRKGVLLSLVLFLVPKTLFLSRTFGFSMTRG